MDVLLDAPVLLIIIAAVAVYILLTSSLVMVRFRRTRQQTAVPALHLECATCGQDNPAKAAYCRRCGKKLG